MEDLTLTEKQFDIIGHSLGVNAYHAKHSRSKRDKILPPDFYRNYFCAGTDNHSDYPILSELESNKLAERFNKFDNLCFAITEKGKRLFIEKFISEIQKDFTQTKSGQRYQDFLDADCGYDFSDFLGIDLPDIEYNGCLWMYKSVKYKGVNGEWEKTKHEAKQSYKDALKRFKKLWKNQSHQTIKQLH